MNWCKKGIFRFDAWDQGSQASRDQQAAQAQEGEKEAQVHHSLKEKCMQLLFFSCQGTNDEWFKFNWSIDIASLLLLFLFSFFSTYIIFTCLFLLFSSSLYFSIQLHTAQHTGDTHRSTVRYAIWRDCCWLFVIPVFLLSSLFVSYSLSFFLSSVWSVTHSSFISQKKSTIIVRFAFATQHTHICMCVCVYTTCTVFFVHGLVIYIYTTHIHPYNHHIPIFSIFQSLYIHIYLAQQYCRIVLS